MFNLFFSVVIPVNIATLGDTVPGVSKSLLIFYRNGDAYVHRTIFLFFVNIFNTNYYYLAGNDVIRFKKVSTDATE